MQTLWLVLGGTSFVAALFAGRSRSAMYIARAALGALYLGAGAVVNAIFLATGVDYADFADSAHLAYVHDTWRSVVAPDQVVFITLLVLFEVLVGALILSGGRRYRRVCGVRSRCTSGCCPSGGSSPSDRS